jgi:uncharacterized membrane protein
MHSTVDNSRNTKIDMMRALAILVMFYAHALPHLALDNYSAFDRVISSLAAPVFLFLVGYNLFPLDTKAKKVKNCWRALIVLALAAAIDVMTWGIMPFYSFDVLYTIGFSIFFLALVGSLNAVKLIVIYALIIAIHAFYLYINAYTFDVNEPDFLDFSQKLSVITVLKNLFFDGWFPIFPWLSFPILGYLLKMKKVKLEGLAVLIIASTLFTIFVLFFNIEDAYLREFAVEIFYPVDILYLIGSISTILLLFTVFSYFTPKKSNILVKLGKLSLLMYFIHLEFYHLFFDGFLHFLNGNFLLTFSLFVVVFLLMTYVITWLKQSPRYNENNLILSVVLGKK